MAMSGNTDPPSRRKPPMDRNPFARARAFLDYNRVAKWFGLLATVGSAVLFVALLGLLGLFVDLVVSQGTIPSFDQLPAPEQEAFLREYRLPDEAAERVALVGKVQQHFDRIEAGRVDLKTSTHLPTWLAGESPRRLPRAEQTLLWYAALPDWLEAAVSPAAAATVRTSIRERIEASGLDSIDRPIPNYGLLSLVVRSRSSYSGGVVRTLAGWEEWTWLDGNRNYLGGLLISAAVLAVLRLALLFLSSYLAARTVVEAVTRLRRAIYHHTHRLGTLAFRALGPSEAVSVSTRHLESVHEGLFLWLTTYFREPVKFGLLLAFAFLINFWLALAFLIFALLVWVAGGQLAAFLRQRGRHVDARSAEQLALIQESLMMTRLVKVYLMEPFNQARVERQLAGYARAQKRRYLGEAIYRPVFAFLGLLAAVVLLYVSGTAILNGEFGVTTAVTLATVLVCCYWPAVAFLDARRTLRRSRDSAGVLFAFLDRKADVRQDLKAEFIPAMTRALEFDKVTLKEPGTGRKLLRGVTLEIKAGQRVAFVGTDEMEKHALVYLLPRFLDPTSGEIRIDGKNLRWVTLDSLRAQIAMVLQHNLVFNDTVANNIGCGDPTYPLPRIIEAAKVAHAHQFIQKLPQGYETMVGEMGHALTAGEKFRLALARAILRDPAIFIIEEPATPLDDDNKDMIDDTLNRVLPGRTVLFLPHRLSTLRNCDRVYLLHEGEIKAAGDHRDLLANNDLYRHLQYLEFNEFAGLIQPPAPVVEEQNL